MRAPTLTERTSLYHERLADLMIEHGVGTRDYRMLKVQRLDEDFFNEDG